jgi:CRP-like cAMP-binding protein
MSRLELFLREHPVFGLASVEARATLLAASTLRTYRDGDRVLSEGDPADRVFALLDGAVRVFHMSPEGAEVVLKLFRAPALFGEAEAFAGGHYVEHVSVVGDAEILLIPTAALRTLLEGSAMAAVSMLADVATRLAIASDHQKSLAFDPVTVRLANYLLDFAEWSNPPDATEWTLRLSQDDMAAAVAATRRSVSKDITAWQREGILERRGDHYCLKDRERLRGYSAATRLKIVYRLPKG